MLDLDLNPNFFGLDHYLLIQKPWKSAVLEYHFSHLENRHNNFLVGLKLNIQKTKIMASSSITS